MVAFITATISGFIGMGGGMTLLGVMTAALPASHVVPLHGVVQLSTNSARTVAYLRHVRWRVVLLYSPPLLIGVYLAMLVWSGDQLSWFKPGIGLFIIGFVVWRHLHSHGDLSGKRVLGSLPLWSFVPLGVVTGFLTIFIGATGPFIAPFFLRDDFTKENIIATKAVCQAGGHFLKIPTFFVLGFDFVPHLPFLAALIVAGIVGTFVGKKILGYLSRRVFTIIFESVLVTIALYLIVSGVALWF